MSDRRLHLIGSGSPAPPTRSTAPLRPYDVALQPQRPGELGRELVLALPRDVAVKIERRAAGAGLPATLWSTLAVEARRSITLAVSMLGLRATVVHETLSAAAAEPGHAARRSRLSDYAQALRAATPREPAATVGGIALRPGLASMTAWQIEAEAAGVVLEAWVLQAIAAAPDGFAVWEAAAADEGRSLPEWALVQAIRRRRSASTPAQIAG